MDDLVSELTGDLEDTIVALTMTPRAYDAKMLHDAIAVSNHGQPFTRPTFEIFVNAFSTKVKQKVPFKHNNTL